MNRRYRKKRNYPHYTQSAKEKRRRLPRFIRRYVLPVLLLLWILSSLFPAQTQSLLDAADTYILSPVCESVVEPYLLTPLDEHVLQPLNEHIWTPIDDTIGAPLRKWVFTPLTEHVITPVWDAISGAVTEHVITPFQNEVIAPLTADVRTALEDYFFTPLGLSSPWNSDSGSGSSGDGSKLAADAVKRSTDFEVHYLDVGQGLSVLVRSGDHALLYDGGDRNHSSFVVAYLKRQGITKLDYLIASHYDADHLSGLIGVLHTTEVDTVLGPDYEHTSKTYTSFQSAVTDAGKTVYHPTAGSDYQLGDAYFTVVGPIKSYTDSNNNSIAIRIVNGDNSFLLTGDAETQSEEDMCRSGLNLYSDVICPGHHGSSNATTSLLLAYTQPTWAVISVGAGNDYGHPHQATLQRLADAGITVLRTDEHGTIVARSDGKDISWSMER
ncbi:MAG: ComEC/Rec2 family competence protein [Lachnospiraceae bacterium]|nr:ComEC/Rec2 family competence protein [Lachnospiraceae bacterium]